MAAFKSAAMAQKAAAKGAGINTRAAVDKILKSEYASIRAGLSWLHRNNALAKSLVDVFKTLILGGGGLTPVGLSEQQQAYWKKWSKRCDSTWTKSFNSLCHSLVTEVLVTGDVLLMAVHNPNGRGSKIRLEIQSGNLVRNPDGVDYNSIYKGLRVRHGVAFDEYGAEAGYWVCKDGDAKFIPRYHQGYWNSILIRNPGSQEAGQVRGIGACSTVASELLYLDDLMNAGLDRAKTEAELGLVIKTNQPLNVCAGIGISGGDATPQDLAHYDALGTVAQGVAESLDIGVAVVPKDFEVAPVAVSTSGDIRALGEASREAICAGFGIPLPFLTSFDMSFSSGKLSGQIIQRRISMVVDELGTSFDEVVELVMAEAWLRGEVDGAEIDVTWAGGQPLGEIDAMKNASAAEKRIGLGLTTLTDELAKEGRTYGDVLERRAAEVAKVKEVCEKYGITVEELLRYAEKEQETKPKEMEEVK